METAREKAIASLQRLLSLGMGHDAPGAVDCAPFVDALIEAARAPESAHTRAVDVANSGEREP